MSTPQREAVHADAAFGTDLYRQLAPRGNVVFSPASIAAALKMALAGARGETAAELARALHAGDPDPAAVAASLRPLAGIRPGDAVTLRAPSTLWLESALPVKDSFLAVLGDVADIRRCDFRHGPETARAAINRAVAEQTAGKITDLLPRGLIDALTRLVLVNAIYLHAPWEHPFPADKTKDQPFYPERARPAPVPLMHLDAALAVSSGNGYQAALLPYRGGALAMAVVLPDGPLSEFTAGLEGAGGAGGIMAGLLDGGEQRQVELALPRFRVEASFRLDDTLQSLGVRRAFTDTADFGGICDEPLSVSAVVHKAYADVGEEGTEAAAATAVAIRPLALRRPRQPDVRLVLDRPFLFVIADTRTGLPLFLGQFTRPSPRSPGA